MLTLVYSSNIAKVKHELLIWDGGNTYLFLRDSQDLMLSHYKSVVAALEGTTTSIMQSFAEVRGSRFVRTPVNASAGTEFISHKRPIK